MNILHPNQKNDSTFLHFSFLSDIKVHGIYFNTFERLLTNYPILKKQHTHDFYSLLFFKNGEGKIKINNNLFGVKPGTVCLISPCQPHSFESAAAMDGLVIFFCQDFYVEEFSFLRLLNLFSCTTKLTGEFCNPCFDLSEKELRQLHSIVDSIDTEYTNYKPFNNSATIIRSLLNIMLLRLSEWNDSISENKNGSDTVLLHELSRMVDSYFIKEHNVYFYTTAFNISEKHLNDLCNRHFNCGLKKILKDRLMQEARKLLLSSELSVSEISYKLNFEDNSYFNKVFKQETNLTPKRFRDLHKKLVP
jgi:AraC family transcriptional regulator, transcriptional activator of pobA